VSSQLALGEPGARMDEARVPASSDGVVASGEDQRLLDGTVAHVLATPALAPWVGMRAGIGWRSEAGLTYTGRSVRADARHAIEGQKLAASAGLGVSGVLQRLRDDRELDPYPSGGSTPYLQSPAQPPSEPFPGVDARSVGGWGVDVPLVVGWRSSGEVAMVWGGARGGHERLGGELWLQDFVEPDKVELAGIDASRWWMGGLLGIAVGVRPIWVGAELDVAYHWLGADIERAEGPTRHVELSGPALAPTGALFGKF
jgi:hypothetical protein